MSENNKHTPRKNEHTKDGAKKPANYLHIGVGLLLVLVVVCFLLGALIFGSLLLFSPYSSSNVNSQSPQTQSQSKCRIVTAQEPYQEQKCQTVPYTDKVCDNIQLKYTRGATVCTKEGWIGDWAVSSCSIANLDDIAGLFTVNVGVIVNGQKNGETSQQTIYPYQSQTFQYRVKASASDCYCNEINIPTKQVCKDVIKTRQDCQTVTKYNTVQKEVCE